METDIKNKTVVITGGANGIGFAIADIFLSNGAKLVFILDISETDGTEAIKKFNSTYGDGKAIFFKCDVTKDLDTVTSKIFEKYQVDVLVNNAGTLDECSLRKTIEVNTIAAIECAMTFWNHMRKDTGGLGGTILNVISIYGFENDPWLAFYKSSKHAMMGFTKTLGHKYNYDKFGVRVIGLCPGYTKTSLIESDLNLWDCHREDYGNFLKEITFQDTETVGKAALEVFNVACSGSSWVTRENKPLEPAPIY